MIRDSCHPELELALEGGRQVGGALNPRGDGQLAGKLGERDHDRLAVGRCV
jgi:hypothetical protein